VLAVEVVVSTGGLVVLVELDVVAQRNRAVLDILDDCACRSWRCSAVRGDASERAT
jgi:hypothetical protein